MGPEGLRRKDRDYPAMRVEAGASFPLFEYVHRERGRRLFVPSPQLHFSVVQLETPKFPPIRFSPILDGRFRDRFDKEKWWFRVEADQRSLLEHDMIKQAKKSRPFSPTHYEFTPEALAQVIRMSLFVGTPEGVVEGRPRASELKKGVLQFGSFISPSGWDRPLFFNPNDAATKKLRARFDFDLVAETFPFSKSGAESVNRAKAATRSSIGAVSTAHLLLGTLDDPSVSEVLHRLDIDVDAILQGVTMWEPEQPEKNAALVHFLPRCYSIFSRAKKESAERGRGRISSCDLLIELAKDDETIPTIILDHAGVNRKDLILELQKQQEVENAITVAENILKDLK